MENNQPLWDLCQPECETSEACTHTTIIHTHIHMRTFTAKEIHTKGAKVNLEANRDWSFYSDICSLPETDGEPIRPPGASATLRLPCHPAAPPLNLHPGTHDRWHLANVTPPLPWKIIYVFITLKLKQKAKNVTQTQSTLTALLSLTKFATNMLT